MTRVSLFTMFLGFGLLGCALPLAAQDAPGPVRTVDPQQVARDVARLEDPADVQRVARALSLRGQHVAAATAWRRAAELRPHVGRYKLEMAAAYAADDRKSEAYTALLDLQQQGYAYDIADDARFAKVADTEVWDYIVQGLKANAQPFGSARVAYTLPKKDLLVESLAWDPTRDALLAAGVREGAVYRVGDDGELTTLVKADDDNGMWGAFDVAVDAERNALWVASTAVPHFRGYEPERDLGRAGVFRFALDSGEFVARYLSPSVPGQSFFISTLTVAPDGTVFAADGVNNAVYTVRDGEFDRLFHAPRLTSIRGMAVDGDGDTLYLADHERGVIGFDLDAGKPFDVGVPKNLALGGIDGLLWWKGHLVVIQNDMMDPARVMRLKLSDDGRTIVEVAAVQANDAAMTLPTYGTVDGNTLYYIANSQKNAYDRFGLLRDESKLEPVRVMKVGIDSATPLQQPNLQSIGG